MDAHKAEALSNVQYLITTLNFNIREEREGGQILDSIELGLTLAHF